MSATRKIVGLIPARAGSKRVPGKNVRNFAGHPLIAYTISAAIDSGVFERVIVSTDSPEVAELCKHYGAEIPFLRPAEYAGDKSPDIEWIQYTLKRLKEEGVLADAFSILRPTSPFRLPSTIQRAWQRFSSIDADSLRAVELCKQHPGKMWTLDGDLMKPLLDDGGINPPWHSTPYQALPVVYAQNASLEMAWSRVPLEQGTIAGKRIIPFFTEEAEGFDINKQEDWWLAESYLQRGLATLPEVRKTPFPTPV
jgi:CMP-N,N'-diacetyllegionaminic acid synthase